MNILIFVPIFFIVGIVAIILFTNNDTTITHRVWTNNVEMNRVTNDNFSEFGDLDVFGISLPKRKESHFRVLEKTLKSEGLKMNYFEALNGKDLDINDYNVTSRYAQFFEQNDKDRKAGIAKNDHRGHLGGLCSHLSVIEMVEKMTLVFEDDADLCPDFAKKLRKMVRDVTEIDEMWDILVLGMSSDYKHHFYNKENDQEPLYKGYLFRVHYWIGLWGYVIRNAEVAQKLLSFFNPVTWHVDIVIAENARIGNLNVYSCIPTIAKHPGLLRISSFDHNQIGRYDLIKSDTNN